MPEDESPFEAYLTTPKLAEFIKLWADEFGVILSENEARREAERLLELYLLVLQPLPDDGLPPAAHPASC